MQFISRNALVQQCSSYHEMPWSNTTRPSRSGSCRALSTLRRMTRRDFNRQFRRMCLRTIMKTGITCMDCTVISHDPKQQLQYFANCNRGRGRVSIRLRTAQCSSRRHVTSPLLASPRVLRALRSRMQSGAGTPRSKRTSAIAGSPRSRIIYPSHERHLRELDALARD